MFVFSFIRPLAGYVLMLFIFLPVGIYGYTSTGDEIGGLFFLLLDVLLFGSALRLYYGPVRRAWFFEDYLKLKGRKIGREIRYPDIKQIAKLNRFPLLSPRTQIRISVSGEEGFLVIPANPPNRKLKTDLYSWLLQKMKQQSAQSHA